MHLDIGTELAGQLLKQCRPAHGAWTLKGHDGLHCQVARCDLKCAPGNQVGEAWFHAGARPWAIASIDQAGPGGHGGPMPR